MPYARHLCSNDRWLVLYLANHLCLTKVMGVDFIRENSWLCLNDNALCSTVNFTCTCEQSNDRQNHYRSCRSICSLYRSWRLNLEKVDHHGRYSGATNSERDRKVQAQYTIHLFSPSLLLIAGRPVHIRCQVPLLLEHPAVASTAWGLSWPCAWTRRLAP